jgi:hypothetical protein
MNILKKLFALPLAVAALVVTDVRAQLTCDQPLPLTLGATPTATLLSFPGFQATAQCQGTRTIHHAAYHRFTAPQDGWYSLHVVPTDAVSWRPMTAILASCNSPSAEIVGHANSGAVLCEAGNLQLRGFSSVSFRMQAGQSRILVVGGETANDAGSAEIRLARIGSTLMDGAQPLALGSNQFSVSALEPSLPYTGACDHWGVDRMGNASRFSFVPAKSGTYRFSFCGSFRWSVALSASPDLEYAGLLTDGFNCPNTGGRIVAALQAGTTYYVAAGLWDNNLDACTTRTATVEFVPRCPADFNQDEVTDGIDLGILLAAWGTPARDITGDGTTDGVDLGILLAMWGACPD